MTLMHRILTLIEVRLTGRVADEHGFEIAQALALAAAAIFATLAIFAVFQGRGTALVNQLFDTISGGL